MKTFTFIIEFLIVGLLLIAVVTIIKRPMEIIRGFLEFIRPSIDRPIILLFLPIWLIAYGLDKAFNLDLIEHSERSEYLSEEPYKSTKNLTFDFKDGSKYIFANTQSDFIIERIRDFLTFSQADLKFEDFIVEKKSPTVVKCPDHIQFYDFNILVQHVCTGLQDVYGVFKSGELGYYCYQDPKTTHNIIGKTNADEKFSIYTLDDLDSKILLRINNRIQIKELNLFSEPSEFPMKGG